MSYPDYGLNRARAWGKLKRESTAYENQRCSNSHHPQKIKRHAS